MGEYNFEASGVFFLAQELEAVRSRARDAREEATAVKDEVQEAARALQEAQNQFDARRTVCNQLINRSISLYFKISLELILSPLWRSWRPVYEKGERERRR